LQETSRNGASDLQRLEFIGSAMGMQARIVLYADDLLAAKTAADAALAEIARLDAILSDWRDDSHVGKVNLEAGGMPVQVDQAFIDVLDRAREISRASDGAFDVTIGPVTQLWREARQSGHQPSQQDIDRAHALVNWQAIEIDSEFRTVRLPLAGMRLDFGGIGKGYAADRALEIVREAGHPMCLVAIAGDIAIGDAPPRANGWRIAAADGMSADSASLPVLELRNCGISTSGDAEQSLAIDGALASHIIDPRNGLGLENRIAVSVIARDAATADALATAVSVLGPQRGMTLIDQIEGASARIATLDGEAISVQQTAAFGASGHP
jgi:thiamine biosynthesis lipoprotein